MRGAADVTVERVLYGTHRFELAKSWEFHIFGELNHYLSDEDRAAGEVIAYRPYERFSEFHVAWADPNDEEPVGLIRFIRHDPAKGLDSFITLRDFHAWPDATGVPQNRLDPEWERHFEQMDPARIAELATKAVVPGHRGEGVVERMWMSLEATSTMEGVDVWTMALVPELYDLYKAMFPLGVNRIGDVIPDYIGADSLPATINTRHPEVQAFKRCLEEIDASRHEVRSAVVNSNFERAQRPDSSVPST